VHVVAELLRRDAHIDTATKVLMSPQNIFAVKAFMYRFQLSTRFTSVLCECNKAQHTVDRVKTYFFHGLD